MSSPPERTPRTYAHAPRVPEGDALPIDVLVPGEGPVMLEIGSGRGAFALEYAASHPEHRVLALEIRRKYATLLAEKLAARGNARARAYAADAREVLPKITPDASVQFVAVHFPDPWWKRRHAKRLVLAGDLPRALARLVAPGGTVFVQTDVEHRAEEYLHAFGAVPEFENAAPAGERFVAESPFVPARSNRERRAIEDGLPIYRVVLRRRAT